MFESYAAWKTHILVYTFRNEADAVLQTVIAQQAASCKQALADSTAEVEAIMESIAASNVMQLEEADVHTVCYAALLIRKLC